MNNKSILLVGILFLLVVSVVVMAILTHTMAGSVKYVWQGTTGNDANIATTKGTDGTKLWDDNKYYFMAPTVMNVIGVVMLGMLLYKV